MPFRLDDYIDGDVAYLAGLIIGRGTLSEVSGVRQLTIEFSYTALEVQGIKAVYASDVAVRLGLDDIRDRLQELLDTDISKVSRNGGVDLVVRFMRNSMIWRNIQLLTNGATSYPYFEIPAVLFAQDLPTAWKREFVRGFADVAGNVRLANRYVDGRNRVRLDVLNYPSNWKLPVQLCRLLQEHLGVPVQLITWGHPNMGRGFREHQLNVFADAFLPIGFSMQHKQDILEELAQANRVAFPNVTPAPCPGARQLKTQKPVDEGESNLGKLDPQLVGKHFDAYWQICRELGCCRRPELGQQLELLDDSGE
ncbi:MAG: hypothetical protein ABFD20_06715 [Anaerolineales bacterium]